MNSPMRFRTRKLVLLFSGLILLFGQTFAAGYPEPMRPKRMVNDFEEIFDASAMERLENQCRQLNDTSSNQIAVVTISTTEGDDIDLYAAELGERWGIGQDKEDNGILILIAKDDRQVAISVGYGLEDVIPDAIAKRVVEAIMIPRFKQADFYKGTSEAVDILGDLAVGKIDEVPTKPFPKWLLIPIIGFIMLMLFGGSRDGGSGTYSRKGRDWHSGRSRGGWIGGTGGGFGGGGGGFGGFSGGGFGGGGASGGW